MKFQGSQNYVATQDLMLAVNASITLKRPLLVKGEPSIVLPVPGSPLTSNGRCNVTEALTATSRSREAI